MIHHYSILCSLFLLCISSTFSQVTFWTEDFNNGCTSLCFANSYSGTNGAWTETLTGSNGAFANAWYVSCAENGTQPGNCGTGCMGNATLHVGNVAGSPAGFCPTGDCGAAYDASIASVVTAKRIESPIIDCSGHFNIQIQYNFIASGSAGSDFYSILYSPDGGTNWSSLGTGAVSNCCCNILDCFLSGCCEPSTTTCGSFRQGNWSQATISLPASADQNPNVKLAFNWENNGDNIGTDPSVAIDDLELAGDVFLPIELVSFTARQVGMSNILNWEVAAETEYDHFEMERSGNGSAWESIGKVDPVNDLVYFEFVDSSPLPGISYYRLREVEVDESFEYSEIVSVTRKKLEQIISIFPNPASQLVSIRKEGPPGSFSINVYNLSGGLVKDKAIVSGNQADLRIDDISPGLYLIEVSYGEIQFIEKLIIKH
ncbi:MAG: T9SS type A sorting domain-containing protein [Bacteroidota bacterium]